jgi:ceramide glucosyltransferase
MPVNLLACLYVLALLAGAASLVYLSGAIVGMARFRPRPTNETAGLSAATVLKPICGLDAGLYENLCSFCRQDYPEFQIVFGVRDAQDPAVAIIERVIAEHPERDLCLVVNPRIVGSNYKVSNLINMLVRAKHPLIVVADSDMRVRPDYLASVIAPFADAKVGAVTCLYRGLADQNWVSQLSAMHINEGFLPSVLVALSLGKLDFCFGATMAVRRTTLERIGGFEAIANQLADDHLLGTLVSRQGEDVRLAPYLVDNIIRERDVFAVLHHELRWARTLLTLAPVGYSLSFVTHPMTLALIGVPLAWISGLANWPAYTLLAVALVLRLLLHYVSRERLGLATPATPALTLLRELLSFGVWAGSFLGRSVSWREQNFSVDRDGQMAALDRYSRGSVKP